MPRAITKLVYLFQELLDAEAAGDMSPRAVARARADLIETHTSHEWYEFGFELWAQALDEIGFEDAEIEFSGFCGQGDGASFTAIVDLEKLVRFLATEIEPADHVNVVDGKEVFAPYVVHKIGGKPPPNPRYTRLTSTWIVVNASVKRDFHNYSHKHTCSVHHGDIHFGNDGYSDTLAVWEAFLEDAEMLRRDLCVALYDDLEAEYEAMTSDEALADFSEANDITYDHFGKLDMSGAFSCPDQVVESGGKLLSPVPRKLLRQPRPKTNPDT